MTGKDFEGFVNWFNEDPNHRSLTIEFDRRKKPTAFVYDYAIQDGQHVEHPEDITFYKSHEDKEYEQYLKLKERYENGKSD